MLKMKKIFCLALCVWCVCIMSAGIADAAVLDDVFEGIVENSFKKAGRNLDDIADLRKAGDTFSTVLRKNDDILDMAGVTRRVADDDLVNLRKMNLPAGSRIADDLMRLPKNQRLLAYALDDVASRIARMPNANDIIKVTGSKGLLIGATYGDDALQGVYRVTRQGEIWDLANNSIRAIDDDFLKAFRENDKILLLFGANTNDVSRLTRIGNLDAMDMSGSVLKRFGKKGLDSTIQLLRWAANNPKTTAVGVVVAMYYANPDWFLDKAGNLKNGIIDAALAGVADISAALVKVPAIASQRILEKLSLTDLPAFIRGPLFYIIYFAVAIGILSIFKFSRFIPVKIFGWMKCCSQAILRRIKTRGRITDSSVSKSDVLRL